MKRLFLGLIIAAAGASAAGCRDQNATAATPPTPPTVSVVTVAPDPVGVERIGTFAETSVDRAGEHVQQQAEIRPGRQLPALTRVLEQPAGRRPMHLPQDAAHAIHLGIAAPGNQDAGDAAPGGRREEGGRAHEQRVQVWLEPADLGSMGRTGELGQGRDDQLGSTRPAAVDGRLVDARTARDVLDAKADVAVLAEHLEGAFENPRDDARASAAGPDRGRSGGTNAGYGGDGSRHGGRSDAVHTNATISCVYGGWSGAIAQCRKDGRSRAPVAMTAPTIVPNDHVVHDGALRTRPSAQGRTL